MGEGPRPVDPGGRGADVDRAIEAVWRIESAGLIARLTRYVGDMSLAEDLAQDALLSALERWPRTGIPAKPGAWLMTIAKRRAIDTFRHSRMAEEKHVLIGREADEERGDPEAHLVAALDDPIGDDMLRLVFICCHPVLAPEARVALTLRMVGGLTTEEIARAFLIPVPTLAQRIVRAKRTLSEARVPFEVPRVEELQERLAAVLGVVYLIFNEGYTATAGDHWTRPALCEDAMRLARMLAELAPEEAEVHGLVALLELQASRLRARVGPGGEPVLLMDQDRSRWDQLLIHRGMRALARAESLGRPLGPYTLQAAIAACHARALDAADTDWVRIVALYDALVALTGSPVVELNRAVAVCMAFGPAAALSLVEELADEPALRSYHLLPTVRGDLLQRLGRYSEAAAEFSRAASLTENERERALLIRRAEEAAGAGSAGSSGSHLKETG